jgi:hypothetical protein
VGTTGSSPATILGVLVRSMRRRGDGGAAARAGAMHTVCQHHGRRTAFLDPMQATQNSQPPAQIESNLDPWKTGIPLDSDLLDTSKLPVDRVEGIYIKRDGGRVKSMCWPSRHTAIVALAATHKDTERTLPAAWMAAAGAMPAPWPPNSFFRSHAGHSKQPTARPDRE